MDISIIYTQKAVSELEKTTRGNQRFSPVDDIARCLSIISDALVNGYEFSATPELISIEIPIGDGTRRLVWTQVSQSTESPYVIIVPNPNWSGGWFTLYSDVSNNSKVWKISRLVLGGRALDL